MIRMAVVSLAASIVAVVVSVSAYVHSRRSSEATFWLRLRQLFSEEHKVVIHRKLRQGDPLSAEEWLGLDDYLGLFEVVECMLRARIIKLSTFRHLYKYRLSNVIQSDEVVKSKLIAEAADWKLLYSLLSRTFPEAKRAIRRIETQSTKSNFEPSSLSSNWSSDADRIAHQFRGPSDRLSSLHYDAFRLVS